MREHECISYPLCWETRWCMSCTRAAEHRGWCEDLAGEGWNHFPQGNPSRSSHLLFSPSHKQNLNDPKKHILDIIILKSFHRVHVVFVLFSPLMHKTRNQYILSSETSEANEKLSLLELLFWKKENGNLYQKDNINYIWWTEKMLNIGWPFLRSLASKAHLFSEQWEIVFMAGQTQHHLQREKKENGAKYLIYSQECY